MTSAPVLVHVHVPKCAGISVGNVLRTAFGHDHLDLYLPSPHSVLTPDELAEQVREHPTVASISSHAVRLYPSTLNGREALYFCFLREPREQFLSYVTYIKKNFADLSAPHRRVVPPDCDRLSLREIAEWIVTHEDEDLPFRRDYTTRFLTSALFRHRNNVPPGSNLDEGMSERYEKTSLALAVEVLDQFLFVGLVEHMEAGLQCLRGKLAPHGLELPDAPMQKDNVSHRARGDTRWLSEADPVGRLVLASLEKDGELYRRIEASLGRTTPVVSARAESLPRITVVTPSYNQASHLRQCIDSVLSQGYPNLQYLVLDGGSTDGTVEILESYGSAVTWRSQRDEGQAAAINEGFRRADGDIIAWLNSDDYYLPGTFDHIRRCFRAHPDAAMVHGRARMVDVKGRTIRHFPSFAFDRSDLARKCYVCQPTVFLKRRIVDEVGLLNEHLDICLDYDWWLRIEKDHGVVFCDRELAASRHYETTKTAARRLRALVEAGYLMRCHFGRASWRWSAKWVVHRWMLSRRRFLLPGFGWVSALQCARRYRRRFDARVTPSVYGRKLLARLGSPSGSAAAAAAEVCAKPLVVHVHIPKTAGQSLYRILGRTFNERRFFFFVRRRVLLLEDHKYNLGGMDAIQSAILEAPETLALSSQKFRLSYPSQLGGRRMLYVTLLRHPATQLRSFFRYVKHDYDTFPPQFKGGLPPDLGRASMTEVAASLVSKRHRWVVERILPTAFFPDAADLAAMDRLLDGFLLAGVVEHFQIALELLRVRLRQHGITVPGVPEPRINVSPKKADEAEAIDGCREVSEYLQTPLMQTNIRLYDHVRRRFTDEVRADLGLDLPCQG